MDQVEFIKNNYELAGPRESNYTPLAENGRMIKGMDRPQLYQLFAKLGYTKGCEVGLERGRNAAVMFENIPGLQLIGVDPYKQHPQASYVYHAEVRKWDQNYLDKIKKQALERLQGKDFRLIQNFSENAADEVPDNSLDFVYIDADHSYDFIMLDVIKWGRKVKKGGILAGHDYYYDKNTSGRRAKVTQAINDYTRIHGINFFITGEDHYHERGDIYPSWFWVKEDDIWPNVVGF